MDKKEINIDDLRQRSTPFTVPQGYFDRQEKQLLEIAGTKRRGRIVPLLVSAAASVAVIAALGMFLLKGDNSTPDLDSYIASLSDADLSDSIALDDLDTYSEFIITDYYN